MYAFLDTAGQRKVPDVIDMFPKKRIGEERNKQKRENE